MPEFGDDHSARDASYEGGNFFEVADQKGMTGPSFERLCVEKLPYGRDHVSPNSLLYKYVQCTSFERLPSI